MSIITTKNNAIEALRLPMAIAIVITHTKLWLDFPTDSLSGMIAECIEVFMRRSIGPTPVPLFFLISGYLYFRNIKPDTPFYIEKTKTRVRSLLIPYICWNLIALGVYLIDDLTRHPGADVLKAVKCLTNGNFLNIFWGSRIWSGANWCLGLIPGTDSFLPIDFPLWFVRNLILICLMAPVIHYFIMRHGKVTIVVLSVAWISQIWVQNDAFAIVGIYYFVLGSYLGVNKKNLTTCFIPYRKLVFSGAAAFNIVNMWLWLGWTDDVVAHMIAMSVIPTVTPMFNCLSAVLISEALCRRYAMYRLISLGKATFFIFASHTLLIQDFAQLVSHKLCLVLIGPEHVMCYLLGYLLSPVLTTGMCLGLFFALRKVCPRFLGVLVGNR